MKDTIYRQAAIDAINEYDFEFPNYMERFVTELRDAMKADLKHDIEALPSVQPEPHWIPCSERLPEKEGWYITTVESEKTGKRRVENDLFVIDIALAHGHTPNRFCKDGHRQRTVAWCEFPEPYKGES